MEIIFIFYFALIATLAKCQTINTTVSANTELGPCICDLTASVCDVECCCDPDCASLLTAFTSCLYSTVTPRVETCVPRVLMFWNNTAYKSRYQGTKVCVYDDSFTSNNYYITPTTLKTANHIYQVKRQYQGFVFQPEVVTFRGIEQFNKTAYMVNDPIYVYFESNTLGKLGLPKATNTPYCDDGNVAVFGVNAASTCLRLVSNLATQCTGLPALSAASYVGNFKFAANYLVFIQNLLANDTTAVPYNATGLIEPNITVVCTDSSGVTTTCSGSLPTPSYASSVCNNVVKDLSFVVTYNGSYGISQVAVSLSLGPLSTTGTFSQKFAVQFNMAGKSTTSSFVRSGNPGYLSGRPVLAGTLQNSSAGVQTIAMNSDSAQWWTVPAGGDCSATGPRQSVNFGVDFQSGCMIKINSSLGSICSEVETEILDALRGPGVPNRVGVFGNVSTSVLDDWVTVVESGASASPNPMRGGCTGIVTGMKVEVVTANVGALTNPQSRIIGVKVEYLRGNIQFMCGGSYCLPDNEVLTQNVAISSTVLFIDASRRNVPTNQNMPVYHSRLAYDFFLPLYVESLGPI